MPLTKEQILNAVAHLEGVCPDVAAMLQKIADLPQAVEPTDFELSKCWVEKPSGEIDGIASMRAALKKFGSSLPQAAEPVAHLWKHSQTGRTRIVMPGGIITADASWFVLGPLILGNTSMQPVRRPLTGPGAENASNPAETRENTGVEGGAEVAAQPAAEWVDAQIRGDAAAAVFNALRVAVPTLGPWSAFDADEVQSMADALKPYLPTRPLAVQQDTLYLLRRLLSNQHTLTGYEFKEELTKIVGEAYDAAATSRQPTQPQTVEHWCTGCQGSNTETCRLNMAAALTQHPPTVEPVGVTSDQRRLIRVIADKIEDGTLFQSGIYSNKDLARFVRNMLDTQPQAVGPTPEDPNSWETNVRALLDNYPLAVRVHEGGGPEDLKASLVVTFMAMQARLAEVAKQQEAKPLFWYRPRSDGCYEGPIHDSSIEEVRKNSGAWVPLVQLITTGSQS